jgi:hypothetical protein
LFVKSTVNASSAPFSHEAFSLKYIDKINDTC